MYSHFSEFYDEVMTDVDYRQWAEYVMELVESTGTSVNSVLELACGTGNVLYELECAQQWKQAIGLDICADMVEKAVSKKTEGTTTDFIVADMINFHFRRKFDLVLCLFDSMNYLTEERELRRTLMNVYFSLNQGKLFIFDVVMPRKLEVFFAGGSHAEDRGDLALIWELSCLELARLYEIKAVFFRRKRGNVYHKYFENHLKRLYTIEELTEILEEMDFAVTGIYDAYTFKSPDKKSQRVFFLCRKGG